MSGSGNPRSGAAHLVADYRDEILSGAAGRRPPAVPHQALAPSGDETVAADGTLRPGWHDLAAVLDRLGPEGLRARCDQVQRLIDDDGVTYGTADPAVAAAGPDGPASAAQRSRWRLDPLPMIIGHREWSGLAAGLRQRAELLDRLQADLYGPRDLLRSGLLPPGPVFGHAGFLRPCDGIRLPGRVQLPVVSTDVVRLADGWCALGDRTQAPSGAGYAMENRRIVSRVLPALYRDTALERLRPFFHTLRSALQEVAPVSAQVPRVVVLTPGSASETSFDQAFLSMLLGFPLVEGQDLIVRDGRVWLRSLGRPEPVDVVLRRVDGWFCDPLQLRPDSRLGVPGLLQAARLGNVSIVNPPGAGVLENPGLVPFLPAVCSALLGEPLRLAPVPTWWCGDPASASHVLANLSRLVVRPIARGIGRANRFGWELSGAELDELAARIRAEPQAWCGQEPLDMSTVPVATQAGLEPRRLVLRSFAVSAGGEFHLMTGGLARVGAQPGALDVSSQAGALSKDVWVIDRIAPAPETPGAGKDDAGLPVPDDADPVPLVPGLPSRVADDMFWLGRYAERAEGVARMLRVATDLASDHARRSGSVGADGLAVMLRALTAVTTTWPGFAGSAEAVRRPQPELIRLASDPSVPGTLAHAVRHTLTAGQAVREQLSNDTWLVLGGLDRTLLDLGWRPEPELHLQQTLSRVLEGLLAFSGLAVENMVRDAGWYVMDAGRRIERSLQLSALLRNTVVESRSGAVDDLVRESVLICTESVITYRRRNPGRPRLEGVLALLLFDRDNPRGVLHQLLALGDDLHRLPAPVPGRADPAVRLRSLLVRIRAGEARSLARDRDSLAEFIDQLSVELTGLADAVAAVHFARPVPPRPQPVEPFEPATPMVDR